MPVDLSLLERWLIGWSLARGLPLPQPHEGGLVVEVGWPDQVRRYVFAEAGPALQACASQIQGPGIYLKAAVEPAALRRALPAPWQLESPRYLMCCPAALPAAAPLATAYTTRISVEHGASVVRLVDARGQTTARGRVVLHGETAVFDRIETLPPYRRQGLGAAVMYVLDALAKQAGVSERLLVATEAGHALYLKIGWQVVAPYSTAVLPGPVGMIC